MQNNHNLTHEAEAFSRYLTGAACPISAHNAYARIMNESNDKTLVFALKHRWTIGMLDGGLALVNPTSEFRRRIYVLFALIECEPTLSHKFLPQKRSPFYLIVMGLVGLRIVARAILGIIIVKSMRLK